MKDVAYGPGKFMKLWTELNPYVTIPDEIARMEKRLKRKNKGKGAMKKPYVKKNNK